MPASCRVIGLLVLSSVLAAFVPVAAQSAPESPLQDWGFDPSVLVADGREILRRAPDREMDGLFQAVHSAAQQPQQAKAMCALFQPQADRSLGGLNSAASRLDQASRERFAMAVADVLVASAQQPPQPYDPASARQALKAAGATAAILDEDFLAGLGSNDSNAQCRSFGLLLDAMQQRPMPERAAVTRLLLLEGLAQVQAAPGS